MDGDHAGPRPDQCFAATGAMDGLVETRPCAVAVGTGLWLASILFVIAGDMMTAAVVVGIILILSGLAGIGRVWARPLSWLGSAILLWLLVSPPAVFTTSKSGYGWRVSA